MGRSTIIAHGLKKLLSDLSGHDPSTFVENVTYLDLGFDSLALTQLAQSASRAFGVRLKLRDFLEDHATIAAMVAHLDAIMPATAEPAPAPAPVVPAPPPAPAPPPLAQPAPSTAMAALLSGARSLGQGPVAELITSQLALMARQLELLAGARIGQIPSQTIGQTASPAATAAGETGATAAATATETTTATITATATDKDKDKAAPPARHGPQLVIEKARTGSLSPTQERHLARLFERYGARTAKSKEFTQRNRATIADPRVPAGFKPALKEIVYPIVVARSSGCRLWDVDGNAYVDLLNGYGSNFFGYGADFVKDAIREQLDVGMEIGPQTPLVEEVSALFRQMVPGAERVAFCNTGSEAVLATLRLARTVSGRDRIVMFQGGYHGIFDEVVARGLPGGRSLPAAPGIPKSATENLTILEYGTEATLEWIRAHADELAGVLVEPVQSRRPDLVPVAFLRELRAITERSGTALIFDEVVTGFRTAPNGTQGMFDIRADIASYGKVIGGGLSIGVVAGRRDYLDALDGGAWCFGDASIPEVGVTYFAGTFVRHPIHLAAARAVLRKLIAEGPAFQQRINDNTATLAGELNALFDSMGAPLSFKHFCSVIRIATTQPVPLGEILFAHLRERGIHAWDGRPCYFTAAHGRAEIDAIVAAFRGAIEDMQEGGFYPRPAQVKSSAEPPVPGARLGRDRTGKPAWFIPDARAESGYVQVGEAK